MNIAARSLSVLLITFGAFASAGCVSEVSPDVDKGTDRQNDDGIAAIDEVTHEGPASEDREARTDFSVYSGEAEGPFPEPWVRVLGPFPEPWQNKAHVETGTGPGRKDPNR